MKKKLSLILVAIGIILLFLIKTNDLIIKNKNYYQTAIMNTVGEEKRLILGEEISNTIAEYEVEKIFNVNSSTHFITKSGILYGIGSTNNLGAGKITDEDGNTIWEALEPVKVADAKDGSFINDGSQKIIDVYKGNNETHFLTESGVLYGFGFVYYLGVGELTDVDGNIISEALEPVKVANAKDGSFINDGSQKIIDVYKGNSETHFITESGMLYGFGYTNNLGVGELTDENGNLIWETLEPVKVANAKDGSFINDGSQKIIDVYRGNNETHFLTESGMLYGFGNTNNLGAGELTDADGNSMWELKSPVKIANAEDGSFINDGSDRVVNLYKSDMGMGVHFITESGVLYGFGNTNNLGVGELTDAEGNPIMEVKVPVKIANAEDGSFINDGSDRVVNLYKLDMGMEFHFLTESGVLYGFGYTNNLGVGELTDAEGNPIMEVKVPVKIADAKDGSFINDGSQKITDVYKGYSNIHFLTESGVLYGFGSTDYLGVGNLIDVEGNPIMKVKVPVKIVNSERGSFVNDGKNKIINIIVKENSDNKFILTESGEVFILGRQGEMNAGFGEVQDDRNILYNGVEGFFSLTSIALQIGKQHKTKYSSNVVVEAIKDNITISLKKENGEFQEITLDFEKKFEIGNASPFLVNNGEEAEFTIKSGTVEYSFVIDKKIPEMKTFSDECNEVNNVHYCNKNFQLNFKDLSGFYEVKKKINEQEFYLTPLENGEEWILDTWILDGNTFETLEVEYIIIDGAGNQIVLIINLDNVPPRISI